MVVEVEVAGVEAAGVAVAVSDSSNPQDSAAIHAFVDLLLEELAVPGLLHSAVELAG